MIEVTRDGIKYVAEKDAKPSLLSSSDFNHIQLAHPENDSIFKTKDVFNLLDQGELKDFVWYGTDFSFVNICDPRAESRYTVDFFNRVNQKIMGSGNEHHAPAPPGFSHENREPRNLSGFYHYDLNPVKAANSQVVQAEHISCKTQESIQLNSIRKAILNYQAGQYKKGIGVVVFYLAINKHEEHYNVSVNFFDIETGTLLLNFRQELKGTGAGMGNHWSANLIKALKRLRNSYGSLYQDLAKIYGIE